MRTDRVFEQRRQHLGLVQRFDGGSREVFDTSLLEILTKVVFFNISQRGCGFRFH